MLTRGVVIILVNMTPSLHEIKAIKIVTLHNKAVHDRTYEVRFGKDNLTTVFSNNSTSGRMISLNTTNVIELEPDKNTEEMINVANIIVGI